MALNNSSKNIIALRRQRVATLRVKGMTQRDIWAALAYGGKNREGQLLNPSTGEPFSLATINGDIQALEKEWRENAAQTTNIHQARQLAEIQAIKIQAFAQSNPALALQAIDKEIKLLGTAAPQNINVNINLVSNFIAALERTGQQPDVFMQRVIDRAKQEYQH